MMPSTVLPYPERDAVPLYFFPFLSPRSHLASAEHVAAYASKLESPDSMFDGETLLYVHIPFCKNLCFFCGFYRDLIHEENILERYVHTLKKEIENVAKYDYINNRKITAVYFGGGTPSILSPELISTLLESIHENFNIKGLCEFTFEGEVRTLADRDRLRVMKNLGCTRVSFGIQTFDSRSRKLSGLIPTMNDIQCCIDTIQEFGYSVNCDLMYGLPGQSYDVIMNDISKAILAGAVNVDLYDTVLYPHTTLFKLRHKLKNDLPTLDERLNMLKGAMGLLSEAGFYQKTIEDFAKPGNEYEMKRLVYGGGNGRSEIIALGAAAVGVVNGYSYRNLPPNEYLAWNARKNKLPIQLLYTMSDNDFQKRALVFSPKVLGLKKSFVNTAWLEQYRSVVDDLKEKNLLTETDTDLLLTEKGLLWTDNIAMTFLNSREQQQIWKIGY
jgi:oxygen-independent coproporphyrinogen-3 oxidase